VHALIILSRALKVRDESTHGYVHDWFYGLRMVLTPLLNARVVDIGLAVNVCGMVSPLTCDLAGRGHAVM